MSNFTITQMITRDNDEGFSTELHCNDGAEFWVIEGPRGDTPGGANVGVMAIFTGDKDSWSLNGYTVKPHVRIESVVVNQSFEADSLPWTATATCVDGDDSWELSASATSLQGAVSEVNARFNAGPDKWAVYGNQLCAG
ncbi:MAG: hypothetical protein GY841_22100 [FCB group bacterium]|nr:hypothetical protein [FCB group bacterium]